MLHKSVLVTYVANSTEISHIHMQIMKILIKVNIIFPVIMIKTLNCNF